MIHTEHEYLHFTVVSPWTILRLTSSLFIRVIFLRIICTVFNKLDSRDIILLTLIKAPYFNSI